MYYLITYCVIMNICINKVQIAATLLQVCYGNKITIARSDYLYDCVNKV
jgi:hypothetical protein